MARINAMNLISSDPRIDAWGQACLFSQPTINWLTTGVKASVLKTVSEQNFVSRFKTGTQFVY